MAASEAGREQIAVYFYPAVYDLKARMDQLRAKEPGTYGRVKGYSALSRDLLEERLDELLGKDGK